MENFFSRTLEHPYEELAAHDGLTPVPAKWMHITLDHKYTRAGDELARIRKRLGRVRQFGATIRRPEAWATAVVCPVYPVLPFAELREIITGQPAGKTFHPHLSLAYCTSRADTRVIRNWMSGHYISEAHIVVTEVSLVRQWHDGANIRWDLVETIPLETGVSG
jgi:2'-5' RNA ligase